MPGIDRLQAVVLDTHAWVWICAGDRRAGALEKFSGRAVVSAISVWEVAMLAQKGRLILKPDVDRWVKNNLEAPVELEPIHPAICIASCRLPDFHGDPADRLIVATALVLGLPLVSADAVIKTWNRHHAQIQIVEI